MDDIRRRAKDRNNVRISLHALEREETRDITLLDVYRVLEHGSIVHGSICEGKNKGEWKAEIEYRRKGDRKISVVTVVPKGDLLYIVTVMWRDTL